MNLARVIGTVWATRKDPNLEGLKMQVIQPINASKKDSGSPIIAVDTVGAGVGENGKTGRENRHCFSQENV